MPGETATFASARSSLANSSEPRLRKASGIGAQTNMVARGLSIFQPARPRPSTSTSRRRRYVSTVSATQACGPSSATIPAIWIGWKTP